MYSVYPSWINLQIKMYWFNNKLPRKYVISNSAVALFLVCSRQKWRHRIVTTPQQLWCGILFTPIEILKLNHLQLLLLFLPHCVQIRISHMLWWFTHVYMRSLSAYGGPVAWCPVDGGPPVGTIQASELRSESELDYWLLQREYPGETSFHFLSGGLPALTDAFTGDDTQTQRWERSPDLIRLFII